MYNILIVDKTILPGMQLLGALNIPDMSVTFTDQVTQARKNVKKNSYDVIILGDRAEDGKVYDVAMEVRAGRKNNHTAVVCVGTNNGKVAMLMKLLSPYALSASASEFENTVARVKAHLALKEVSHS